MAAYKRRQILLKREDGTPAGFMRIERTDNRCDVEVQVETQNKELIAFLLDGDQAFPLGKITRNRTIHAPKVDEMYRYNRAAILSGDRLLFAGGEDADFISMRKALNRSRQSESKAISFTERQTNRQANHPVTAVSSGSPNAAPLPLVPEDSKIEATSIEQAVDTASKSPADLAQAQVHPAIKPIKFDEGWVFTPYDMGSIKCYTGHLMRGGRSVAAMHAVAGTYDPEPPPGLSGFVWDSGYWVKVSADESALA